jgi:sec-independent protein translocase protein TatB
VFGLTFEKLLLIGVLAVIIVGPERLPRYAASLARFVKWLKSFADGARSRMREEMGPEFDEVDWKKLDPRQYDPRRIIREALIEDEPPPRQVVRPARRPSAPAQKPAGAAESDAAAEPPAAEPPAAEPPAAGPPADSRTVAGASVIAAARSTGSASADSGGADGAASTPYDAEAT